MIQTKHRSAIAVVVAATVAALLAVFLFTRNADAQEPPVGSTAVADTTAALFAADTVVENVDLQQMILEVPTPKGFSRVGSQVATVGGGDSTETLIVGEVKFRAPDRSAMTVLLITGGDWSLEREMAVGDSRASSILPVGQRTGVIIAGDHLTSISWPASGDLILQVVHRGGALSRSELAEYATLIAGVSP